MKYRQLASNLPELSCMALGTLYLVENQKRFFDEAYGRGINGFDTADSYNLGESDKVLAAFMRGKPREKLVISSKVFHPTPFGLPGGGLSKGNILKSVDASLGRLETDYLDILYLHRFDPDTPIAETLEALAMLIESQKIKHWGLSAFSRSQVLETCITAKKLGVQVPIVAQYAYNLFNRNIEGDLGTTLSEQQIRVIGYYGLSQGVLTGKYSKGIIPKHSRANNAEALPYMWDFTPEKIAIARKFTEFSASLKANPVAVALAWCLQNGIVASCLTHVSSLNQLAQCVEAINLHLTKEDNEILNEIFLVEG